MLEGNLAVLAANHYESIYEQLYQDIGIEAAALATKLAGRLLVYSEVESGVISADIFYVENGNEKIRFRFASPPLRDKIYSFWKAWKEMEGNSEWMAMCYVVDDGGFSIELTYREDLLGLGSLADRRPLIIEKYFGSVGIDYSNP